LSYDYFENIISPCVNICRYDDSAEYCIGCKRTPIEITKWFVLSNEERENILTELPKRNIVSQKLK
tara:strand:- start:268 stop:465 length:198 start_codon:yes stop_codon:yes gene_type:complete